MLRTAKVMLISLLFLMAVTPLSFAYSSETYTLSKAVSTALVESPTVLLSESIAVGASWKKIETYSGFLPSVAVSGTHLLNKKYMLTNLVFGGAPISVPQILPSSNLALNVELPLFDGFSSTHRLLSARSFQKGAEADLDWTRFQAEHEVILQFYRALGAKLLRQVAIQNLKSIEDHLKDSRLFKKSGLLTNYDVLRVEVQESEALSELLNAEDNVIAEKNKLASLIGTDQEINEVEGSFPLLPSDLLKDVKFDNLDLRHDLRAYSERETSARYTEASDSTYWVPKVSLFYQFQYYNNLNNQITATDKYREAYQLGVSATWNIFDGMSSFSKSKQSVEEHKKAEILAQSARLKAKEDLDFWKRKFGYYSTVYRSRSDDVEKSSESVRLAKEGRRVGVRTNNELLDAELDLFRSRANAVRAQLGAIESLLRLELASGRRLYQFY